jgi:hypothetical protein
MSEAMPLRWSISIIVAVVVLWLGWWTASSAMEARAYNRVTGANVSTWDAMWIELRVQEGAK